MAALENGAHLDGELLPAVAALPQPRARGLPLKAIDAIRRAAVWADRPVRPDDAFQLGVCRLFVVEVELAQDAHDRSPLGP